MVVTSVAGGILYLETNILTLSHTVMFGDMNAHLGLNITHLVISGVKMKENKR